MKLYEEYDILEGKLKRRNLPWFFSCVENSVASNLTHLYDEMIDTSNFMGFWSVQPNGQPLHYKVSNYQVCRYDGVLVVSRVIVYPIH